MRNIKRNTSEWLALGLIAAAIAGCHDDRNRVVVVEPDRRATVDRHQDPDDVVVVDRDDDDRDVVVVREAPPAVVVERRPARPAGAVIWVDGYWRYDGHRHVWTKGRYIRQQPNARYVAPRWVKTSRGHEFHRERWVRSRR